VAIKIKDPNYNGYTIQFGTILWVKLRYGYMVSRNRHFKKNQKEPMKIEEDLWSHLVWRSMSVLLSREWKD
jgi:hypothetical protein